MDTVYPLILLPAFLLTVTLSFYVWLQYRNAIAKPFLVMTLSSLEWIFFTMIYYTNSDASYAQYIVAMQFIGIALISPAWLAFTILFTGRTLRFKPILYLGSVLIAIIMTLLVATNDLHQLVWRDVVVDGQVHTVFWTAYWLFTMYSYGLLVLGNALIIERMLKTDAIFKWQCWIILLAGFFPIMASVTFSFHLIPNATIDLTPFSFVISMILLWWGVYNLRILDLKPVAHSLLLNTMKDGMLVVDEKQRLIDSNQAAQGMFHDLSARSIGQHVNHLAVWSAIQDYLTQAPKDSSDNTYTIHHDSRVFEVRVTPLLNWHERSSNHLLIFRDITIRHHAEQERDALVTKLQTALEEVKTLAEFIPICSYCRKVRDDSGYWEQVEAYIARHTDSEFSHGICPDCMTKHHPNVQQD